MLEPLLTKLSEKGVLFVTTSKQRQALIDKLKLPFECFPSSGLEDLDPKEHTFSDFVEKTALRKVNDVFEHFKTRSDISKPEIYIAGDTMVTHNGRMYGKPKSEEEAVQILTNLTQSGVPHAVYTGMAIRFKDHIRTFTEVTTVYMVKLEKEEILAYIKTGEPW